MLVQSAALVQVYDVVECSGFYSSPVMQLRGGGDRRFLIAGNWKMNPESLDQAKALATSVVETSKSLKKDIDVCICCPHPFLTTSSDICKGSKVEVGAQDIFTEEKGAFTGGVSIKQVKSIGCKYVLVGHSERRHGNIASESNAVINKKVKMTIDSGLVACLCIGETKEEFEAKKNKEVCAKQLAEGLAGVTKEQLAHVVLAYEPVWAIGTGYTASPEIAQDVHKFVRQWLEENYDKATADSVRILYGGSVTPDNVDQLMACPGERAGGARRSHADLTAADIDGALVGGASLVGEKFARIMNFN
eukprot:754568-Hanusia_phi.AAC.1